MTRVVALRRYWSWLGRRLRLSQPGRAVFTVALLVGGAAVLFAWANGAREGGAPFVVLAMLAAGVIALDAVARGGVSVGRRLIVRSRPRRHS